MMGANVPPSSGAVSDAMSLLKVLSDPAAAQALLAKYQEAAATHDQQLASVMVRLKEVEAKETQLNDREAKVVARENEQTSRQGMLDRLAQDHKTHGQKLAADIAALAARVRVHEQAVRDFNEAKSSQDSLHIVRMAQVAEQDAKNAEAYKERMAALDVREAALDKREQALARSEQVLESKHAKLRAALE